jgi:hypothetical protein
LPAAALSFFFAPDQRALFFFTVTVLLLGIRAIHSPAETMAPEAAG